MSLESAGLYGPTAILGQTGTPAPTLNVDVYAHGTTTHVALFTDNTGASSSANPAVTDSRGNLAFYAAPGVYDLHFNLGGTDTTIIVEVLPWFVDSGIPSGVVMGWAAGGAPTGWLACDGSAVSRLLYASLFTAISTAFGNGDGSTTFNLPDCRGRTIFGTGGPGGNGQPALAINGPAGEAFHILSVAEEPTHAHGVTDPDHYHLANAAGNTSYQGIFTAPVDTGYHIPGPGNTVAGMGSFVTVEFNPAYDVTVNTTGISIQNQGGNAAHNNMPPYLAMAWIIKA